MPLVSIIIPNYNHAPFLKQRIDSVLDQTFQDFEVIILDDCSLDNSREIIESYRNHPKISHIIYNEKNSGSTFKQWKKGIDLAIGEWIWIAESDDWCEAVFLDNVLESDNVNSETVISFAQAYIINEAKKSCYASYNGDALFYNLDGLLFIKKKMLPYNGIWNASQAIFRRKYYYKLSSEYLKYKFCGDWIFWVELSLMGDVAVCGKIISYFRKHDKDVTSKSTKSGIRYFEEFDALRYFNHLLADKAYFSRHNTYYTHYKQLCNIRKSITKEDMKRLKKKYSQQFTSKQKIKLRLNEFFGYLKIF
ncbi:Glycosyltransferase involved in cell wall bisynthesis [Epilithonimonas lactis]|nr:Glycosyltransferase involved in cell wall bisynthesis [Epilithonimonas lactis]